MLLGTLGVWTSEQSDLEVVAYVATCHALACARDSRPYIKARPRGPLIQILCVLKKVWFVDVKPSLLSKVGACMKRQIGVIDVDMA